MRKIITVWILVCFVCSTYALDIKYNKNPIYDKKPEVVREITNGRLDIVGEGDDTIQIVHVWGSSYEMGLAEGMLLKDEIAEYFDTILTLMTKELGGNIQLLDQVYEKTKHFIPNHFMEEMKGLAEGSGQELQDIIRVNMIGEASEWHCSLFGAWGSATASTGSLIQLRALDYEVHAEIQRYPVITVYHPDQGHAFANIGWSGFVGAVTGISSSQLAISEIGDDYDKKNDSFEGIPFSFMLRDILQFDETLEDAITRVKKGPRTTSLMYAIGDGKKGEARSLQTSRTLCNVFDSENLQPLTPSHPRIKDIVYWGMSWNVPKYDQRLHDMLVRHYGDITPEITIREILPTVGTGNLQIAVYDLTNMILWTANAKCNKESGPLNAYERQFVRLDMNELFSQ